MKKHPKVTPIQLCALSGMPQRVVTDTLRTMYRLKRVDKAGSGEAARYWALGKVPVDVRGYAPGSLAALARYNHLWAERLTNAHKTLGNEIEISCAISGKKVVQKGRERAPAKSVQIPSLGDLASSLLGD